MKEEFDAVLKKKNLKNRKAANLDEIPTKVGKTRKFDDKLLVLCNAIYKQNTKWIKYCILLFPKEGDIKITKNYRGSALAGKFVNSIVSDLKSRKS